MRHLPAPIRSLIDQLAAGDGVEALDLALARTLAEYDARDAETREPAAPQRTRTVAMTTVLLARVRRSGHSVVELDAWAGRPAAEPVPDRLPDAARWLDALADSPVVGGPDDGLPLVLEGRRVALARFHHAERRIAEAIADRLDAPTESVSQRARDAFAVLFPRAEPDDRQALAAVAALRSRVVLLAGGPGTGKTYTATRLLALLLAHEPGLRIALAAPTGKAARRLTQSLTDGIESLPEALRSGLPTQATTLHQLLGARPGEGFRHDARRPLPHDVVLVDEASMVDLPLFEALVRALLPAARLVVLGDPDQLASVELGAVFGDLVGMGDHAPSAGLSEFAATFGLSGFGTSGLGTSGAPLADAVVTLARSRRFDAASGLGRLALALRDGAAPELAPTDDSVEHRAVAEAVAWALPHARRIVSAASPREALDRLAAQQLLAVVRHGERGVEGLNRAIEHALRAERLVSWNAWRDPFYAGRPILVTEQAPRLGLSNGDIGVAGFDRGREAVFFPDGYGVRPVPLARMPEHEPAWAVTVHKSQGSEFERVGVVLPEPGTRGAGLVTRELLYTAVTRARLAVTVFGEAALVAEGAARRTERATALRDRLGEALYAACRA